MKIKYLLPLLAVCAVLTGCERQSTSDTYSNTNAPSAAPSTPSTPVAPSTNATPPTP